MIPPGRSQNPDHLLLFSVGNDGGYKDSTRGVCTIGSPALGKNSLAIGATSTGPTRSPYTMNDGRLRYEAMGLYSYATDGSPYIETFPELGLPSNSIVAASIDTVAYFSSYGRRSTCASSLRFSLLVTRWGSWGKLWITGTRCVEFLLAILHVIELYKTELRGMDAEI